MPRIDWQRWWRLPLKLRFLLAGGYNTVFGYLVFSGMYLLFGRWIHYLVIGVLAHFIAVISAFVVHRHLVFRAADAWRRSFIRFNLSQLVALGFGMSCLYSLVTWGHLSPLVAQAIVVAASVLLTYALHRHFSFRHEPPAR